jgi:ubiquinone/menaquinone biosynthesis C-methylase UbiE
MPKTPMSSAIHAQRDYYARTAASYDVRHIGPADEHSTALSAFMALAELAGPVTSVLDVGAGTGRAVRMLKDAWPAATILGVEPVAALRAEARNRGLSGDEIRDGDALSLEFADGSFDYVIATGVLHHIEDPERAVREMVRVAKRGVMISDSNNIGQGNALVRLLKYLIKTMGLWRALVFVQTGGRMYKCSEGDGIYFSYCAFDAVKILQRKFPSIHYMNTQPCAGINLYRGATHVMLFARS